jgi:hypothetical protein
VSELVLDTDAVITENPIRADELERHGLVPLPFRVWELVRAFLGTMRSLFKTRRELALENLALRQQIGVLTRNRGNRRVRLGRWDRGFWVVLSHVWTGWREALAVVEPATVIRWHRDGFRRFWTRRSRTRRPGRPGLAPDVVGLIRRMSKRT